MPKIVNELCVCGYKKAFKLCCGRFLDGGAWAKTPEQVVRSRFSAYALGGYGEYLLATWFPATAAGLTVEELSLRSVYWHRLDLLSKSQQGDKAEVEFKAYFSKNENDKQHEVMHEYSSFIRSKGRWYYIGGKVVG